MPYLLNQNQTVTIDITPSQEIGSGGMGTVYRIGNLLGTGNLVAKLFKNPQDPKNPSQAKLQSMIDRPPEHVYEVIDGVGYTQFAWVQHLIFSDDGQLIGYAMPELDFDHSLSLNPFMYPREATRLTDYQNSLNYRVQLGANISALMADLHSHGHAFIDFKEQNLRLLPEPKTGLNDDFKGFIVGFVDCDSFRITGQDGTVYPSPVISPEMTSPEYHEHKTISRLDQKHDRFVLAIELFKILNYGIHPFYFIPLSERLKNAANRNTDQFIKERLYAYGVVPHPEIAPLKNSIHQCWDDTTRSMFDQAFLSTDPNQRPTAQDWEKHFRDLISQRDFVACQNYPNEISHIHFASKPCHRCLWLSTEKTLNQKNSHAQPDLVDEVDSVWRQVNTQTPNITPTATQPSPWQSAPAAFNHSQNSDNPAVEQRTQRPNATATTQNNAIYEENLEQNRAWEQSLKQTPPQATIPTSEPVSTPQTGFDTQIPADIDQFATPTAPHTPEAAQVTNVTDNHYSSPPASSPATPKASNAKKWLIPVVLGVLGIGGYAIVQQKDKDTPNPANVASQEADNSPNTATAKASDNTATAYQTTIKELPKAKATIDKELASQSKGGLFGSSVDGLYEDTLGFSPEFLSAVKKTAKQGEPDLQRLIKTANTQDIDATMTLAMSSFRDADLGYFAEQKVNKTLAKQYNESAKNYYWNKKDPKSALILQAKAVQNNPTQGEYAANLAFYLVKTNYPKAKDFVLYALQTPRDANKYPNTYMIELASALAVKDGDAEGAKGALLAQYYTADDRAKRCQNMLKYPVTYPELVSIAEKVLTVIDEQNNEGIMPSPNACKPPFNWAN